MFILRHVDFIIYVDDFKNSLMTSHRHFNAVFKYFIEKCPRNKIIHQRKESMTLQKSHFYILVDKSC